MKKLRVLATPSPLPKCVTKTGGTVQFTNITAGQYLAQRLAEIGLKK